MLRSLQAKHIAASDSQWLPQTVNVANSIKLAAILEDSTICNDKPTMTGEVTLLDTFQMRWLGSKGAELVIEQCKHRIAVLDNNPDSASLTAKVLSNAGCRTVLFTSPDRFLAQLHHDTFDVLLLDWVLPDVSALEVLVQMKKVRPKVAVIILTARTGDEDIVQALNAGADDFLSKPLSGIVMVARIEAAMRRLSMNFGKFTEVFDYAGYRFDQLRRVVQFDGLAVSLTNREFALAQLFFSNPNRPLSRRYVLDMLWGKSTDYHSRTLDTHIARLRMKLDLGLKRGVKLATLYGYGYCLELESVRAAA